MEIILNLGPLFSFFSLPVEEMFRRLVFYYGWMILAVIFLNGALMCWLTWRRRLWYRKQKFTLLAIDIPKANDQSPKALENMFSYLAGAHGSINLIENYWEGKFQLGFSFEIVGIDGYIQFLVRTPAAFRNLVETAVYSQYPNAEIAEVEDYVDSVPNNYPNPDYDVWGAEFVPVQMEPEFKQALPIRTYKEFEYQMGKPEFHFKDPMATLMDLMSSLRPGEQIWYQILLLPIAADWSKIGKPAIDNVLGVKPKAEPGLIESFFDWSIETLGNVSEMIYSIWGDLPKSAVKEDKNDPLKMMNLLPAQKKQVEAIQEKISKMGYAVKLRVVYASRREVMNKPKVVNGVVGYIKQFGSNDLNALKPDTKITMTSASYFNKINLINTKKRKVVQAYKDRDDTAGRNAWYLNVEEIATLWHFPIESVVKAPMIQKSTSKKMEPPMSLPVDDHGQDDLGLDELFNIDDEDQSQFEEAKIAAEEELMIEPEPVFEPESELEPELKPGSRQAPPPSNLPGV
ncbi:MAG TPA: hypothetical protein PLT32_00480 [bacterium]|nr:hypothetical protein [bacterium]